MRFANDKSSFVDPRSVPLATVSHCRQVPTIVEVVPDIVSLVVHPPDGETIRCEAYGEICTATAAKFGLALGALIPCGRWTIELDLTGVEFMDARGITMLLGLASDDRVEQLRTPRVSAAVERLFSCCGLVGTGWPTSAGPG